MSLKIQFHIKFKPLKTDIGENSDLKIFFVQDLETDIF